MTEFVTVRLRCPVCDTEFMVDELHGSRPVARDTDFRPVHEGADPLLTHVHACPSCSYAAYREGFELEPGDEDELLEPIEDDPKSLLRPAIEIPDEEDGADLRRYARSGELTDGLVETGREPFGAVRYLLAARVAEYLGTADALGLAHYYLRAAWCARGAGERGREQEALREVLLRISATLEAGTVKDTERLRLAYLGGEVARRAGDFGRAADLFAIVEKEADQDEDEGSLLATLARRQNLLAQMKSDVNARIPAELPGRRRRADEGDDEAPEDVWADDDDDTLN